MTTANPESEGTMSEITITRNAFSSQVKTTLPVSQRSTSIDVYRPDTVFGEPTPAKVNWAGIGSVEAGDARAYAALIAAAADEADQLDAYARAVEVADQIQADRAAR